MTSGRMLRTLAGLAGGLALYTVLLPAPEAAAAPRVLIKLATLVPDGSTWHQILKETGEKWKQISGGSVTVRIYPGGIAGDDPDVVRKMRLGTLQAGVLTAVGVAEIDKAVYALGVPLMYESYDEVYAVLEGMRPRLEAALDAKGFVVLNWADAGWVQFFAKTPIATPDDLKQQKLFVWQGDNTAVDIWRSGGFNPIPLPATELATAIQTGLVTSLGAPPQVAVLSQYFLHAPHMTDLSWQMLLGATVVSKSTWERIPAELRPAMLAAAREAGQRLRDDVRGSRERDIEAMKRRGLDVVAVDTRTRALWQKTAESFYAKVRGPVVPADAFDEAMRLRDEYRRQHASAR